MQAHLLPPSYEGDDIHNVIQSIRKVPSIAIAFYVLCLSRMTNWLLEYALAEVTIKSGGLEDVKPELLT